MYDRHIFLLQNPTPELFSRRMINAALQVGNSFVQDIVGRYKFDLLTRERLDKGAGTRPELIAIMKECRPTA